MANLLWTPVASPDWLPDDPPFPQEYWDTRNFKRDSPWNAWNFSTQDPVISVLMLELLGKAAASIGRVIGIPARDSGTSFRCVVRRLVMLNSFLREDIIALMEDVGVYGLVHDDVTAFNLLRFTDSKTETPQARCSRHNIVHGWRIIDPNRSLKVDMENPGIKSKETPGKFNSAYIGRRICRDISLG